MTNPNAVLNDKDHDWRYNRIPDYNKVNATYEQGNFNLSITKTGWLLILYIILLEKTVTHEENSLEWLVSNLVKVRTYKKKKGSIYTVYSTSLIELGKGNVI